MSSSPRLKIAPAVRVHPIYSKPPVKAKKSLAQQLSWTEQLAVLDKYDRWRENCLSLGVKPSVNRFEARYAKKNQVSRLLKNREKLQGLMAVTPTATAD
ncbi:hypothetical protein EDD11_000818, partial [Mortierella claussenii]